MRGPNNAAARAREINPRHEQGSHRRSNRYECRSHEGSAAAASTPHLTRPRPGKRRPIS